MQSTCATLHKGTRTAKGLKQHRPFVQALLQNTEVVNCQWDTFDDVLVVAVLHDLTKDGGFFRLVSLLERAYSHGWVYCPRNDRGTISVHFGLLLADGTSAPFYNGEAPFAGVATQAGRNKVRHAMPSASGKWEYVVYSHVARDSTVGTAVIKVVENLHPVSNGYFVGASNFRPLTVTVKTVLLEMNSVCTRQRASCAIRGSIIGAHDAALLFHETIICMVTFNCQTASSYPIYVSW